MRVLDEVSVPNNLSVQEVLNSRKVVGLGDTDLITLSFRSGDPEIAIAFANGYLDVYTADRQEAAEASFQAALTQLDESISDVDSELTTVENAILDELTSQGAESPFVDQLNSEIEAYLAIPNPTPEQLEQVIRQLDALRLAQTVEQQDTDLVLLLEQRTEIADRKNQLVIRRDQVEIDSALALSGVQSSSPAIAAVPVSSGIQILAIAIILGAFAGVAIAYARYLRNESFGNRRDPETVLNAPLLGEVPRFQPRNPDDILPVYSSPSSPAAEAFRFTSAAMDARIENLANDRALRSVAFTSAYLGDGKTVVTLNTALAAASIGKSVLIIDGDFGDPALTRFILSRNKDIPKTAYGMTNIIQDRIALSEAITPINLKPGIRINLLARGNANIPALDFFRSGATVDLFRKIAQEYDQVIIDCPPLLQVSYATSLVRMADAVVAIVPHESPVAAQRELVDRLEVAGARLLGYVYNKAPLRPEMAQSRGSLKNPIGSPLAPRRP